MKFYLGGLFVCIVAFPTFYSVLFYNLSYLAGLAWFYNKQ
jgi:hypothetical protein